MCSLTRECVLLLKNVFSLQTCCRCERKRCSFCFLCVWHLQVATEETLNFNLEYDPELGFCGFIVFIYLFIHSFFHSFVHLFICLFICLAHFSFLFLFVCLLFHLLGYNFGIYQRYNIGMFGCTSLRLNSYERDKH